LTENAAEVTGQAQPAVSIIIPTYNERDRLADLVEGACSLFARHGVAAQLIVVDDNSPDGTGRLAESLAERYPLRVVHRPGKLGLGSAVIDGFAVADSDVVGVMDADLSHPPEALLRLLAALRALDVDAVIGSRYIPGGGSTDWSLARLAMSRLACEFARFLTPVRDATSGLFLVKQAAVRGVVISAAGFKICLELLVRGRVASVAEVPYTFVGRTAGQSKMNLAEAVGYLGQLVSLHGHRFFASGAPRRQRYVRLTLAESLQHVSTLFPPTSR
jgi:dolichol-phosphate mannosyltransferase